MPPVLEEYANEEPIGGTGFELAGTSPGFMYTGPVAGEDQARADWNQQAIAGAPIPERDLSGNAYARTTALQFDADKAEAEAQRNIEYAYNQARTSQQMKAVEAARQMQGRYAIQRDIARGVPMAQAITKHYGSLSPADVRAVTGLEKELEPDPVPTVRDFGEGIGKAVVTGRQVRFPPVTGVTANGPVQGEPLLDPQTQEPVPNKLVVRSRNGGFHIVDTAPPRTPPMTGKVTLPGPNQYTPGPTISGPVEGMARYGVTNFSNLGPQGSTTKEVIRVTKDGRKAIFDVNTKRFIRYAD